MVSTEGVLSLYKGLIPTLIGIAPYAATNFASYDMIKTAAYSSGYFKVELQLNKSLSMNPPDVHSFSSVQESRRTGLTTS